MKKIAVWVFIWFLCFAVATVADNKVELKNLLTKISQVKDDLKQKEQQQASVKQKLGHLKRKIFLLESDLKITDKKLKLQLANLFRLTKEQERVQGKLKASENKLANELNLVYQLEKPCQLKSIFLSESALTAELFSSYSQNILAAKLEQMVDLKKSLVALIRNKQAIKQQSKNLENLVAEQQQQKLALEEAKAEQNQLLSKLKNKIISQNDKLEKLLVAKKNLENLINNLTQKPAALLSVGAKIKLCRKFVWPTVGRITTHFGSAIGQTAWRWHGLIIRAAKNQEVHAILPGRVIYAGWLIGYGLLLIIDHQQGYLSLYGHNQQLLKKLNDQVRSGETIAKVGSTDSEVAQLYFAIRYNGKPVDPEKWCQK